MDGAALFSAVSRFGTYVDAYSLPGLTQTQACDDADSLRFYQPEVSQPPS